MVVWGIASQETRSTVRRFAEQYGITFPILLDETGRVNSDYAQSVPFPSGAYPQDWIIGADGRVRYVNNGFELDAMLHVLDDELDFD